MPQSLSQVIVHIVFSTKDRQKWLDAPISPRMHAYLATVCRDHDCEAYRVGGVVDHVHLAVRLGRTISQADLIETIKTSSSAWIKKQGHGYRSFFCNEVTGLSRWDSANWIPWYNTSTARRSIIGQKPSRRSIASCCSSTTSNSMNVTCGIDQREWRTLMTRGRTDESRRWRLAMLFHAPIPGALPGRCPRLV